MSLYINKALIDQVIKKVDKEQLRPLLQQLDEDGVKAVERLLRPFIQDEALLKQLMDGLMGDLKHPGGPAAPPSRGQTSGDGPGSS